MQRSIRIASLFSVVLAIATNSQAATITVDALKDATIFQNNVNNSSGAGNGLFAGTNGTGSPRRALLAFDVAGALPAGAVVQDVQLTLFLGQVAGSGGGNPPGGTTDQTIELHRLLADWGEGITQQQNPPSDTLGGQGQGAAAGEGDATWNARFYSAAAPTLWASPGGDFSPAASAAAAVGTSVGTPYQWPSTPLLVSDVQGWLANPASNFGWLIKNSDEGTATNFRAFYTRDAATTAFHPQLTVTYSVVPEPSSVLLSLIAFTFLVYVNRSSQRFFSVPDCSRINA